MDTKFVFKSITDLVTLIAKCLLIFAELVRHGLRNQKIQKY
jgi:hypothetical protein